MIADFINRHRLTVSAVGRIHRQLVWQKLLMLIRLVR